MEQKPEVSQETQNRESEPVSFAAEQLRYGFDGGGGAGISTSIVVGAAVVLLVLLLVVGFLGATNPPATELPEITPDPMVTQGIGALQAEVTEVLGTVAALEQTMEMDAAALQVRADDLQTQVAQMQSSIREQLTSYQNQLDTLEAVLTLLPTPVSPTPETGGEAPVEATAVDSAEGSVDETPVPPVTETPGDGASTGSMATVTPTSVPDGVPVEIQPVLATINTDNPNVRSAPDTTQDTAVGTFTIGAEVAAVAFITNTDPSATTWLAVVVREEDGGFVPGFNPIEGIEPTAIGDVVYIADFLANPIVQGEAFDSLPTTVPPNFELLPPATPVPVPPGDNPPDNDGPAGGIPTSNP